MQIGDRVCGYGYWRKRWSAGQAAGLLCALTSALCLSTGSVLARLAQPFTAWQIAALRTFVGVLLLWCGMKLWKREVKIRGVGWPLIVWMGVSIGLSFALFFLALKYTSVAHALTFFYLSPIFVALGSRVFFGDRILPLHYIGMIVVIFGVGLVTRFEMRMNADMLAGNLISASGGLFSAGYSLAARSLPKSTPRTAAALWIYLVAALCLAPMGVLEPLRVDSAMQVIAIALLGLIPLVGGHTLYLYSIKFIHPAGANTISSLEVIGGSALAWIVLGESLGSQAIAGAIMVQCGLILVLRRMPECQRGSPTAAALQDKF